MLKKLKFWLDYFLDSFMLNAGLTGRCLAKALQPQLFLLWLVVKSVLPYLSFKVAFFVAWIILSTLIMNAHLTDVPDIELEKGDYY